MTGRRSVSAMPVLMTREEKRLAESLLESRVAGSKAAVIAGRDAVPLC